ncbi:hypothetical protein PAHAL_2G080700 [Panicum hallii]|uniref:Glycosyltransferase n=1 Tax=Panicum hallii TaxID=206008 RepID=A0A2S3GX38_9POAL|nr:DIMBOA UDP-glucosyltransferase BX8-like [Panicum hallii]PAN10235.1 hypothetical protein PAHAL_2G080700 [Panicum hallii]
MAGDWRSPIGRRVVLFPFPSGSHITPMLQLAGLLRARGLGVTVLHADFNAPDPARHPELAFVSIRESLPDEVAASPDQAERMMGLNAACEAPFQAALEELVRRGGGPVACAVVDGQWYGMLGAARRAGVPALALGAGSAAAFLAMLAAPRPRADGYVPIEEADRLDEVVPGLEPLRVRDLIGLDGSDGETVLRFAASVAGAVRDASSGVVLNTFDAIEGPELAGIRRELSRPVFAVGPLHLAAGPPAVQQHAPDGGCLAWLDARPPRSVLYVSLGSAARVDRAAFEEMAWGLAGSGVPFLWVLRPGSVGGAADADGDLPPFPEELHETVRRRGKVVAWSPQGAVLAHPAVGGFWTHCGWSSVVEAVCEGVPMLVHPCLADQTVSAMYVARRWGVGMEVGRVVERTAMARAIRRLMAREHGPQAPRERARLLRTQARQCVAEGGPASLAIDDLVEYIMGL